MSWRKLGHIYAPDGSLPWARSYAANPVAEQIDGDLYRIYFSARDETNRSSIGYIELDIRKPDRILQVAQQPVLAPGDLAMFDDSGASIGCIVRVGGRRLLYYMGWHLTVTVPWQNAIGVAGSESADAPFVRYSRFPTVPLDEVDPYTISYPWVMHDQGRFRMWYGSNISWGREKRDMRHLIKYAESDDGIHWHRDNVIAINFSGPEEYAMCKPCVVRDGDIYRMWFCARGDAYRIFEAESSDGISWRRYDRPALDVTPGAWDSDMVEYPCVFDHGGLRYMLYAGNTFGKTGFGLAVQD